jgi:type IV pilus assembly protein PilY1
MSTHHHYDSTPELTQTAALACEPRQPASAILHWVRQKALVIVTVPLVAAVSFLALSQSTAPNIPVIDLSADPLYAATSGDKPVLALALSVEFPTVGAQYVDPDNNGTSDDVTYSPSIEYLGYYDAESCYTYDDIGVGAPTGQASNYKRFVRRGPAIPLATPNVENPTWTKRLCWDGGKSYSKDDGTTPVYSTASNDAFSGNFLNWASNSAIDMLRLSLTGGDRVIDTPTLTVLQRAIIPDGDPISMGNSSNFPSKRLYRSGTSRAITSANFASASFASGVPYFGAVPTALATAAGANDIFVANTLNRIYFGTGKAGNNSGGFGSYTLGSSGGASGYQIGTISPSTQTLPSSSVYQRGTVSDSSSALTTANQVGPVSDVYTTRPFTSDSCANKGDFCALPAGTWEVWYGKNSNWKVAPATGSTLCSATQFGNPTGNSEKCYYRAYTGAWTPAASATFCAAINGTCALPAGTWKVWYGENTSTTSGNWKAAQATGAVPCTQAVFGNPTGSSEQCYYTAGDGSWTPAPNVTECASEGGSCALPSGTWEVLYGANTSWKIAPVSGTVPCTNTVWGDPISGVGKKCFYRPYTGAWTPTAAVASLNSDGYFFARVQVCDRDPTTYTLKDKRYWNLCTQYSDGATDPHASFKPTGTIQKYSDQLRLAAFGYLLDQTASYSSGRYGGVLRAPMKYVGAKTFDTNGAENTPDGGNTRQEWNSVTGVFNTNPDSNSTVQTTDGRGAYLSGVISYLNQFGRTGAVPGRYKKYDPIGELHYETVRYLQGLSPSADAISGLTTEMYDGFPVATNASTGWTDPYGDGRSNTTDYSCLKSNIVVIGDKNTHDGNRLPSASAANNIPDISAWRTVVQNFEKNVAASYVDGAGATRTTGNPNGANGSVPTGSTTSQIMGSAYWSHIKDIRGTAWTNATSAGTAGTTLQRPGLRVKTFMFDVNEYGGSNDANTRRTSNQLFTAAKYGGFEADPSNAAKNPYNTRGNPFVNEKDGTNSNDVWRDTDLRPTRSGEANTYFLQSDARGVLSAFEDIFSRASTAAYNIGGGANDSKSLKIVDTIYQGKFDTSDWSGDLEAGSASTKVLKWSAANRLDALSAPATSRNIVVGKVGATSNPVATDFTWGAIEGSLQTALGTTAADGLGQDRLNYLRGDKSKEGSPFRKRTKLLGDIINSGVVYSGKPGTDISSTSYASFASTNAARTAAVFVGANDGMLHAFNAGTGDELFAYIPSWLGPKLAALTNASYGKGTTLHQSYVDSIPAVGEAQVGSAGTAADWKTVLVGGTGGGGQGVFALDITDPSNFSAANVMWEFTDSDDPDLGNVMGKPQILKLRTSAYNATTATYKWFAVVGSGVNNYRNDGAGLFSTTGNPALFLLDLSKSAGAAWSLGSNYYKIPLPVSSTLSQSKATGLVNFTAELSSGGDVARMYLGDLHGNLWKLDFSVSMGSSEWNINKLSAFNKGTVASPDPYPMFIAKDGSGSEQSITASPLIASGSERDTRYIYFGTGKYYESADKSSTTTQTEYMVYDNGSTSGDTLTGGAVRASAISGRLRLKQGTANASTGLIATPAYTNGRAATNVNTEEIRSGWYADLPTSGERQISDGTLLPLSTQIIFNSLIPGASGSTGCAIARDGGRTYKIDIATGNGSSSESSVGLLGEVMVVDRPDLTTRTLTDSTGRGIKIITSDVYQLGSQGWKKTESVTTQVVAGRLSWRQINNYQDLKNAP